MPVSNAEEANQRSEQRKEKIRSIAVLPFADLSAEQDQEHFSDGVAEEILNALSKVGGLHVPARTSCFAFRGATLDAREIGKRLGVEFARQMFERAVKVDPDFATAWAGLANAYVDLFRWSRKPRDLEEAKR